MRYYGGLRGGLMIACCMIAASALSGCQTIGYDGYALSDCVGTIEAGHCTIGWGGGLAPPPGVLVEPAPVVAQPAPAPETGEPPATDPTAATP